MAQTQPARPRMVVDSQVHLWNAETDQFKFDPAFKPQLPEPFTAEKLVPMMEEAGVDRAIIISPLWPTDRNAYVLDAVKRYSLA